MTIELDSEWLTAEAAFAAREDVEFRMQKLEREVAQKLRVGGTD